MSKWTSFKGSVKGAIRIFDQQLYLILISLAFLALASALRAGVLILVRSLIDTVVHKTSTDWLLHLSVGGALCMVLRRSVIFLQEYTSLTAVERSVSQLRAHYFESSKDMAIAGQSTRDLERGASYIASLRKAFIILALGSHEVVLIPLYVAVGFYLDWQLALVALAILPLILVPAFLLKSRISRSVEKRASGTLRFKKMLMEAMGSGFRADRLLSANTQVDRLHRDEATRMAEENAQSVVLLSLPYLLLTALVATVSGFFVWYQGHKIIAGEATAGSFLVFIVTVILIFLAIHKLISLLPAFVGFGEALYFMYALPDGSAVEAGTKDLPAQIEDLQFQAVSLSALGNSPPMAGLDGSFKRGEIVAILSSNGNGAGPLISILMKGRADFEGKVSFDGLDLSDVKIDSLRRRIWVCLTEPPILDGTVATNIACGLEEDLDQVRAAAERAGVSSIFEIMDQGYLTQLSGMERSFTPPRLTMALWLSRAHYRDPAVMVLDEDSYGVDINAFGTLKTMIVSFLKERITFMIPQRQSTLQEADRVLFINQQGEVILGSPESLQNHEEYVQIVNKLY